MTYVNMDNSYDNIDKLNIMLVIISNLNKV